MRFTLNTLVGASPTWHVSVDNSTVLVCVYVQQHYCSRNVEHEILCPLQNANYRNRLGVRFTNPSAPIRSPVTCRFRPSCASLLAYSGRGCLDREGGPPSTRRIQTTWVYRLYPERDFGVAPQPVCPGTFHHPRPTGGHSGWVKFR